MEKHNSLQKFIVACCLLLVIAVAAGLVLPLTARAQQPVGDEASTTNINEEGPLPGMESSLEQPAPEAGEDTPESEADTGTVFRYDTQPKTLEEVLGWLSGREPRWEQPLPEALVPEGYWQEQRQAEDGSLYYTLIWDGENENEAETQAEETQPGIVDISGAAGLREAVAGATSGDVLLLHGDIVLGADGDGGPALMLPSGVQLTLRADEDGPYTIYRRDAARHFALEGAVDTTLVFEGVTLASASTGGEAALGGGIAVTGSTNIRIEGAVLRGNTAADGGALAIQDSDITLVDAQLAGNRAMRGGAIFLDGSTLVLQGSTSINSNTAEGETKGLGGGMWIGGGSTLAAGGSLAIESNSASAVGGKGYGGGLYLASSGAVAQLGTGTLLAANHADIGGGAYLNAGAQFILDGGAGAAIRDNTATKGGGGICVYEGGAASLMGSVQVENNTAATGGAVYLYNYDGLSTGAGVAFAANKADSGGEATDSAMLQQHARKMGATAFTQPYTCAYNNMDVNYVGDTGSTAASYTTDNGPTRRMQREQQTRRLKGAGYGYAAYEGAYPEKQRLATDEPRTDAMADETAGDALAAGAAGTAGLSFLLGKEPTASIMLLQQAASTPSGQGLQGGTGAPPRVQQAAKASRVGPLPAAGIAPQVVPAESGAGWSLLSLLLATASLAMAGMLLLGLFSYRCVQGSRHCWTLRRVWESDRLGLGWGVLGILTGPVALAVLLCTQELAGSMRLFDAASGVLLGLCLLQVALVCLLRLNGQTGDSPGRYWSGSVGEE